MAKKKTYTFIDLFAGIGGFHQAMHSVGMKCVFASEWDKNARISYEANYKYGHENEMYKEPMNLKRGKGVYMRELRECGGRTEDKTKCAKG